MKLMMERLGAPQTHLALKSMIQEVDEDQDGKISFKEVGMHEGLLGDTSKTATYSSLT